MKKLLFIAFLVFIGSSVLVKSQTHYVSINTPIKLHNECYLDIFLQNDSITIDDFNFSIIDKKITFVDFELGYMFIEMNAIDSNKRDCVFYLVLHETKLSTIVVNYGGLELLILEPEDILNGVFYNEDITELSNYCIYSNLDLTEVILPNLISCNIGNFYYCPNLIKVETPKLMNISNKCFSNLESLEILELTELSSCGNDCFANNKSIRTIICNERTEFGNGCLINNRLLTNFNKYRSLIRKKTKCQSH